MRRFTQLSQEERYIITAGLRSKLSITEIAQNLGRPLCTVYRELGRNRNTHDDYYRAEVAHQYAVARRHRARRGSQFSPEYWQEIIYYLKKKYSPEQIVGVLARKGTIPISHETIYKFILKDKRRGGLLFTNLRIMPKRRRKRYNSHDSRGTLPGKKHISKRPQSAESRRTLGHWEGDTVIGADRHHCIVTLTERKTGFVIIKKVRRRSSKEVTKACLRAIRSHTDKFKTITFDNGTEFHGYKEIENLFHVPCYFATPYHSWERGTNENTNGLIRQYLPKKTCMKNVSQAYCDWIANELNSRPRKRLGFLTPKEVFYA